MTYGLLTLARLEELSIMLQWFDRLIHPNLLTLQKKLQDFYHGSQGGGYSIWDPWQCLVLAKYGYSSHELPLMIRPSGGEIPPPPEGLEIIEAKDEKTLALVENTLIKG